MEQARKQARGGESLGGTLEGRRGMRDGGRREDKRGRGGGGAE